MRRVPDTSDRGGYGVTVLLVVLFAVWYSLVSAAVFAMWLQVLEKHHQSPRLPMDLTASFLWPLSVPLCGCFVFYYGVRGAKRSL